jgi:hypothetical protein
MKRRVASLPPISIAIFNEKVLERRTETAVMSSPKGSFCEVCKLVGYVLFLIIRNPLITQQNIYHGKRLSLSYTIKET